MFTTSRYTNPRLPYLYLYLTATTNSNKNLFIAFVIVSRSDFQCNFQVFTSSFCSVCSFAHVDTTTDDAKRMCSTLNGTIVLSKRLLFQLAHSATTGNKPLAEVNGSPVEYNAREKAVTPVHDERGAGDAGCQMPQRQQQQLFASVPHTSYTPPATKPAGGNLDSMYLDDPAVVSSTPHCYPLFKQNDVIAGRDSTLHAHTPRSVNDAVTQDRWTPAVYGKMDNIVQREGMHQS